MSDPNTLRRLDALERALETLRKADAALLSIRCRVFNTAAITIATATNTALTFDSETYDTDGIHSTSANTGRLTCQHAGCYHLFGHAEFASNATGSRQIFIRRNGTDALAAILVPAANGTVTVLSVATDVELVAGDYLELIAFQNSGGNLNVDAANYYTPYFGMTRVA